MSVCAWVKFRPEKVCGERLPGPTCAGVSSPRRPSPLILPDKLVDYVVVPEQVKSRIFIMEPPAGVAPVKEVKRFQ